MTDHQYEQRSFADLDAEEDVAIETAVLELIMFGQRVGLTVEDLTSVLRSGLSRQEVVKYMTDRLVGRIQ